METRDIVLALLILCVGVGIFYLLDPTMAGLLKKQDSKSEGFFPESGGDETPAAEYERLTNLIEDINTGRVMAAPGMLQAHKSRQAALAEMLGEGFANLTDAPGVGVPTMHHQSGNQQQYDNETAQYALPTATRGGAVEGFETLTPAPVPMKDADKPANCYPKDQINPQELLPNDPNSKWAQVNPMGQGDIAGKNYLSAGALIGVNTIGQSLRNANYQLRSDPPNPQVKVSIWNQSTIEPDTNRRPMEIA